MNARTYVTAASVILGIVLPLVAAASEPPELRHNPFSRPPSETIRAESPISDIAEASDAILDLRATMVGSKDRLANVGGRVLKQGDEIQGYVLVHVHEDHAVFVRNGRRKTVYVKPDLVEEDD